MRVAPIAAPGGTSERPAASTQGLDAKMERVRAIASGAQAVQNQNQISPEELGAIRTPEAQIHSPEEAIAAPSEAPSAETKAPEEPISPQLAALARKEKAFRLREQQLKAREAAFKAAEEAAKAPVKPAFDESKYIPKDKIAADPFSVLSELGISYDQLTELALNAPKPEQIALNRELQALKDEIKALKGDQDNTRKSYQEQQDQTYKQAIKQLSSETKSLVESDPQFETIKETNSVRDVVELIEQTFKEDGILMSVEDAATQVENYLVEEAMKLTRIKKIQQRLQPKGAAPSAKSTGQPQQQQLKTLTNAVASNRQLSAKERALLAFEGKLGK